MNARHTALSLVIGLMAACGGMVDGPAPAGGAYSEHGEASDFDLAPTVPGKGDDVSPIFDANHIVSDDFFLDSGAMTVTDIQAFLDSTPYGNRSWLATASDGGMSVAQLVADISVRHSINPMLILARFQVEGSHISKSQHPGQRSANRALGCGCFDGQQCQSQYLGIQKQIECAADVLERRFEGSVDGTWSWQRGVATTSLDGIRVTPSSHGTAALYAYTPWVLVNRGGNWLVWNITKRFLGHTPEAGTIGTVNPTNPNVPLWVGAPCTSDDQCNFQSGEDFGFCYDFVDVATFETRGFCSIVCEGFCPDRSGAPTTFCIEADVGGVGICASKSESLNNFCADVPGTVSRDVERFIGTSAAPAGTANVCAPNDQ